MPEVQLNNTAPGENLDQIHSQAILIRLEIDDLGSMNAVYTFSVHFAGVILNNY
jgi:hypothetical protein